MISIIICSIKKELRDAITLNIEETVGVEHEIITIENEIHKFSISKAYNLGASRAKYPYLCFSHEDIRFHTVSWGKILIKNFVETQARLIGIVGSTIKSKYPSSVFLAASEKNRQFHLQRWPDKPVTKPYINPFQEPYSEVCILDGLFIASTKLAWEETKFSEDYLTGFHGYDIDFSLKNFLLGKNVVIYNILLEHFSLGSFNKQWVDTQILLSKKWNSKLPAFVHNTAKKDIDVINRIAIEELLMVIVPMRYNFFIEIKYYILQLRYSLLSKWNFYFIIRILLRKKGRDILKYIFSNAKSLLKFD